jgi:S-formylglutathione hydrolase
MDIVSVTRSHGGRQLVCRHPSRETGTDMTFGIYLPPQAEAGPRVPLVWYLSGLTCTHANVVEKGGFQRVCAELGLILVAPDTSPRGPEVPDHPDFDFGQGAGFYVDATEEPFAANYRMYSYVAAELPDLVASEFAADLSRQAITGHSMGGHGALTIALRNPGRYRGVSAFAPIVAPSQVPWGEKALGGYLGPDRSAWRAHDAVALIEDGARVPEILVDQGAADSFLERELRPGLLTMACEKAGIPLTLRMQDGYDHSYYFISTFMEDHLRWHAQHLSRHPGESGDLGEARRDFSSVGPGFRRDDER